MATRKSLRGRLLVATPALGDPNFARTVVLLLEHGDEGAAGLILNRPSMTRVVDPLPEVGTLAASPDVVFVGGPVQPGAVVCLGRGVPAAGFEAVLGGVGTIDLRSLDELRPRVTELRVFSGFAGWAPQQLEREILDGAWFVVDAEPSDALSPAPERLWQDVLRRQGGELALVATYPPDPRLN